jgi:hypothetical protein
MIHECMCAYIQSCWKTSYINAKAHELWMVAIEFTIWILQNLLGQGGCQKRYRNPKEPRAWTTCTALTSSASNAWPWRQGSQELNHLEITESKSESSANHNWITSARGFWNWNFDISRQQSSTLCVCSAQFLTRHCMNWSHRPHEPVQIQRSGAIDHVLTNPWQSARVSQCTRPANTFYLRDQPVCGKGGPFSTSMNWSWTGPTSWDIAL